MSVNIVVALRAEAKHLIEAWKLRRLDAGRAAMSAFPIFVGTLPQPPQPPQLPALQGEAETGRVPVALVISGVGRVASGAATATLGALRACGGTVLAPDGLDFTVPSEHSVWLNFGVAGGDRLDSGRSVEVGDCVLATRVIDEERRRVTDEERGRVLDGERRRVIDEESRRLVDETRRSEVDEAHRRVINPESRRVTPCEGHNRVQFADRSSCDDDGRTGAALGSVAAQPEAPALGGALALRASRVPTWLPPSVIRTDDLEAQSKDRSAGDSTATTDLSLPRGRPRLHRATVRTVDGPETSYSLPGLYEMEAAGFVETALRLASAELVQVVKVVSDAPHTPLEQLSRTSIEAACAPATELLTALCARWVALARSLPPVDAQVAELEERTAVELRLTASRRLELERLVERSVALRGVNATLEELRIVRAGANVGSNDGTNGRTLDRPVRVDRRAVVRALGDMAARLDRNAVEHVGDRSSKPK